MPSKDPVRKEVAKRSAVYTKVPGTILIKIYGLDLIPGFPEMVRDGAQIEATHADEARARNLATHVYRSNKNDTGLRIINQQKGVRFYEFLGQLAGKGWVITGFHYYWDKGKFPVHVVEYRISNVSVEVPPAVWGVLRNCQFEVTVWANLKYRKTDEQEKTGKQYRLDTIILGSPHRSNQSARQLSFGGKKGRTYCLVG
ncbi:MAG: hypothetical protein WCV73_01480 [Patescibacteria group bacterium]|jgi:hypothetical protein